MKVAELFKKSLKEMLHTGEFEKTYLYARSMSERKNVKKDIEMLEEIERHGSIETMPIIPLIMNLHSIDVYRDLMSFMLLLEAKDNGK